MSSPREHFEADPAARLGRGPGSHADRLATLESIAPGWLDARFAETEVLAALPRFHDGDDGLGDIWRAALPALSPAEDAAEAELSRDCGRTGRLGITRAGTVDFQFPRPAADGTRRRSDVGLSEADARAMRDLGWAPRHVHQTGRANEYSDDVHHRRAGAAGRLICHAPFRAARDAVRDQWQALDAGVRPPLPLGRSPRLERAPAGGRRQRETAVSSFQRNFDAFCDGWRLLGMVTWDLPGVAGPRWVEGLPPDADGPEGVDVLDTPWHFPLEGQDGLGELIADRHRRRAERHGIDDQGRWETYARLLLINFWGRAVRARYAGRPRRRDEATRVDAVLAELTGLDNERVKRLGSVLRSLQDGRRASLRGFR